jgi:MarR family transcriptional regulator, organic hydroperoxide resistance regulator
MKQKYERATKHPGLEALRHAPGTCSCQKLRSAARAVTKMYDELLRPTGLTIGQFLVLAALYYVPSMPLLKLAKRLEMDRTTLTRSLAILERDGLVSITLDPEDNRVRCVTMTDAGLARLTEAYPLWAKAQEELSRALGSRELKDFRQSLDNSIAVLTA